MIGDGDRLCSQEKLALIQGQLKSSDQSKRVMVGLKKRLELQRRW